MDIRILLFCTFLPFRKKKYTKVKILTSSSLLTYHHQLYDIYKFEYLHLMFSLEGIWK